MDSDFEKLIGPDGNEIATMLDHCPEDRWLSRDCQSMVRELNKLYTENQDLQKKIKELESK